MRWIKPLAILVTVAGLTLADAVSAEILHVPADHATIDAALDVAQPGDEVMVAPGVYPESDLHLPAGVHLAGDGATPDETSIDAGGADRVLTVEGGDSVVRNLRVTGGAARVGGGILVQPGTPALLDLVVSGCHADLGGGIALVGGGAPTLERCYLVQNTAAGLGGGLYLVDVATLVLHDCLLAGNEAAGAGGAWYAARGSLGLEGCTVVDNRAPLGAEGACFDGDRVTVENTIVTGNHPAAGWSDDDLEAVLITDHASRALNTCTLRHEPGWPGYLAAQRNIAFAHNLHDDPLFCGDEGYPQTLWGLAANSPCAADNNPDCGRIGAFGVACGPIAAPDTPGVACRLHPPYPNPFNPSTHVRFETARTGPVQLAVYSLDGRRVVTLVSGELPAGNHSITWRGRDRLGRALASGVYVCRLRADGLTATARLTLVK